MGFASGVILRGEERRFWRWWWRMTDEERDANRELAKVWAKTKGIRHGTDRLEAGDYE